MTAPTRAAHRLLAVSALAAAFATAAPAAPVDDMSLGSPAAPVTVIEYASLGCPHCGVWAREVFPQFKRRYIDTGKVRFVLREMLFGDANVAAAGFLTARCAGRAKYFQVVEGLFDAQPRMQSDGDDEPTLLEVAGAAGLTRAQVAACLGDHAALAALEARSDGYTRDDHIVATPTFDIAGAKIEGDVNLDTLASAIDAAEVSARRRRR